MICTPSLNDLEPPMKDETSLSIHRNRLSFNDGRGA